MSGGEAQRNYTFFKAWIVQSFEVPRSKSTRKKPQIKLAIIFPTGNMIKVNLNLNINGREPDFQTKFS